MKARAGKIGKLPPFRSPRSEDKLQPFNSTRRRRDEDSIHVLATSPTLSANILQTARLCEELLCLLLDPPFSFGPRRRLTNHRVPSLNSKFPDRAHFGCPNRPDDDNINKYKKGEENIVSHISKEKHQSRRYRGPLLHSAYTSYKGDEASHICRRNIYSCLTRRKGPRKLAGADGVLSSPFWLLASCSPLIF